MGSLEAGGSSVAEGLEALRNAHRLHMSRTLHDQIGPSLCSAGLMLGLVRSATGELDPTSTGLLDSIQDALETAIDSVRALSYAADPGLGVRCGFRSALSYITQSHPAELVFTQDARLLSGKGADAACRIIQDALIALPQPAEVNARRVECGNGGVTLTSPGLLPSATLPALRHMVSTAGQTLMHTLP